MVIQMMHNVCHEALGLIDAGEDFAYLRIAEAKGSTPREAGAAMIVRKDGSIFGTIGGGRLEADGMHAAVTAIERRESTRLSISLSNKDAALSDMICGGEVTIQVDFIAADDPKNADTFRAACEDRGDTLVLFGAGHVAREIARAASIAGFSCTVVDDRSQFANAERFPDANALVVPDMRSFPDLNMPENAYIAIVTRGHLFDADCLDWSLALPDPKPIYIGMIGSRRKVALLFEEMKKRGHSQEAIDRVHAPIGLDIGAQTPGEIAISVVAQLIERRHGRI